jgi:hypothetical protein
MSAIKSVLPNRHCYWNFVIVSEPGKSVPLTFQGTNPPFDPSVYGRYRRILLGLKRGESTQFGPRADCERAKAQAIFSSSSDKSSKLRVE